MSTLASPLPHHRTPETPSHTGAAPAAVTHLARPFRLAEPTELAMMRERVAAARTDRIGREQVVRVLESVRAGQSLADVATGTHLTEARVLDVVAGIGSRLSQINKRGPKAEAIVYASDGAPLPMTQSRLVAVIPSGFEPSAPHGRNVTRALAAVLVADPASAERPIDRFLTATQPTCLPVEYTHLVHWHFLAQRGPHSLDSEPFDVDVTDAFIRAWDLLAAEIVAAVGALARLVISRLTVAELATAADTARWLAPDIALMAETATAVEAGDTTAAARLPRMLVNLRRSVASAPARFTPRSLADLTRDQLRLIAARHGMGPADIADGSQPNHGLEAFARAMAAARAAIEAEPNPSSTNS